MGPFETRAGVPGDPVEAKGFEQEGAEVAEGRTPALPLPLLTLPLLPLRPPVQAFCTDCDRDTVAFVSRPIPRSTPTPSCAPSTRLPGICVPLSEKRIPTTSRDLRPLTGPRINARNSPNGLTRSRGHGPACRGSLFLLSEKGSPPRRGSLVSSPAGILSPADRGLRTSDCLFCAPLADQQIASAS